MVLTVFIRHDVKFEHSAKKLNLKTTTLFDKMQKTANLPSIIS